MKREDDVQLIYRILSGDAAAFRVLVEKHQKGVHALVWRKIGDFHYAEEITQDTFLRAYKKLSTLKDPNQFTGWLYVIANRLCIDWLRKQKFTMQSLEDTPVEEIDKVAYAHHISEQRQTETAENQREIVKQLLAKLPESERTVVTLYYLGEMTTKEIGKFLGVSVDTIKTRLRRGRKRLQAQQVEPLVSETLGAIQFPAHITERIMQQVTDMGPIQPPVGKPVLPWIVFGTVVVVVMSMLGVSNQYLARFQKPYSFEAESEPTIEIIDAFIVLDIAAKPSVRNQGGRADASQESRGIDTQVSDTTSASLTSGDTVTFARTAELKIEQTLTQADGLASDRVLTVFEDSHGTVWFGTTDGLTRYDGKNFQTFTTEDGLAQNTIGLIFEDQRGMLWFAGGVLSNFLERGKPIDVSWMETPLSELDITPHNETPEGMTRRIPSKGVSRYDGEKFRVFTNADGLAGDTVKDIFEDKTGTLWFATSSGVSHYDGETFNTITVNGPIGMDVLPHWWSQITAIAQDTAGNFWFGSTAGITYYDVQTTRFRHFAVDSDFAPFQEMGQARSANITDLQFDTNDNLWMSQSSGSEENSGIRRFNGKKLAIFPQSEQLPMNSVDNILQDRNGNLWFAGVKNAMNPPPMIQETEESVSLVFPEAESSISVYNGKTFQNFNTADGLPSNRVWSVFEDSRGKLWFATDKGVGVGIYTPAPAHKEN